MRSDDLPNKKQKLHGELGEILPAATDNSEACSELAVAAHVQVSESDISVTSQFKKAARSSNCGSRFVLDPKGRLYVIVVQDSETLQEILTTLATMAGSSPYKPQDVTMHCQGVILENVNITAAKTGLSQGYPLSVHSRKLRGPARCQVKLSALLAYGQHTWRQACEECIAEKLEESPDGLVDMGEIVSKLYRLLLKTPEGDCDIAKWQWNLQHLLECRSIPMMITLCQLSEDKSTSLLQETHQAASKCLCSIEGYLRDVLLAAKVVQSGRARPLHKDSVPAALFLTLELTSHVLQHAMSAPEATASQDNAESSSVTAVMVHHLKHLADDLDSVRKFWTRDMFSQQRFHVSARRHAMMQLALCIRQAVKILGESLSELQEHIWLFASSPSSSLKLQDNLQLTAAYSTLVQAYVALQDPDVTEDIKSMMACHNNFLRIVKGCSHACGVFATACVRLGVACAEDSVDQYTGETIASTEEKRYEAGLPKAFREHIAGLLPGVHALAYPEFVLDATEAAEAQSLFQEIVKLEAVEASLTAAGLRPGGALMPGMSNMHDEFAQHLNEGLRRQYLHELFADTSLELTYHAGGADWNKITISRSDLVAESEAEDIVLTKTSYVVFKDEPGVGSGVMKEWITAYGQWLFSPKSGLAVKYSCPLGVQLSRCFLKALSGRSCGDADYDQVDCQIWSSIKRVLEASEEELQQMGLTFELPSGESFPDQIEGSHGQSVTKETVTQFAEFMEARYFSCRDEATHFVTGLASMCEYDVWRTALDQDTYQNSYMLRAVLPEDFGNMLCGQLAPLCVEEWRAATYVKGFYYKDSLQNVEWFWEMVEGMTQEQQKQLLRFWTALHTLPAGGFEELPSRLQLCAGHQKLPTSHTCAFQLNIPRRAGLDEMKSAFDTALTQSEGFGFA